MRFSKIKDEKNAQPRVEVEHGGVELLLGENYCCRNQSSA